MKEGRKLKAVIPGGSSAKVLRGDEKFKIKEKGPDGAMVDKEITIDDIPMDFDTLAAVGSMAGFRRGHRHGRLAQHGRDARQHQRILRARKLRPMHPVPRGFAVDAKNHPAHGQRRGRETGPRRAQERGRQHRGQDDLRVWRGVRVADAEFCGQVQGGIRGQGDRKTSFRARCPMASRWRMAVPVVVTGHEVAHATEVATV